MYQAAICGQILINNAVVVNRSSLCAIRLASTKSFYLWVYVSGLESVSIQTGAVPKRQRARRNLVAGHPWASLSPASPFRVHRLSRWTNSPRSSAPVQARPRLQLAVRTRHPPTQLGFSIAIAVQPSPSGTELPNSQFRSEHCKRDHKSTISLVFISRFIPVPNHTKGVHTAPETHCEQPSNSSPLCETACVLSVR